MIDKEIDLSGQTLGNYKIVSRLGQGGMAVVYKAHESSLNRVVALKVLSSRLSQDAEYIARFEREARAAARLSHPNIVQVYAIGETQGVHFFAMEYVKGRPLSDLKKERGKLEYHDALPLIKQVAVALSAAHRAGLVHRDIKPSNIMVDSLDQVKVTDFGIAYVSGEQTKLTREGSIIGTPEYLSPEQCEGKQLDGRSDIYSLGVTFYELLTGRTPYEADTPVSMLMKIIKGSFPPLAEVNPEVPAQVVKVVEKMMRTNADDRYGSADLLIADLEHLERELTGARDMSVPVPGTATLTRDTKKRNRNRALAVTAVIALLMGGAFAARIIHLDKQDPPRQEEVRDTSQAVTVETTSFEPDSSPLAGDGEQTAAAADAGAATGLGIVADGEDAVPGQSTDVAGEEGPGGERALAGDSPQIAAADVSTPTSSHGTTVGRNVARTPQRAVRPRPPANSVVLTTMGDEDKVDLLETLLQSRLGDGGFKIIDGPSVSAAQTADVARYRLVTSVKLLGVTTLQYYGSSSEMYTVSITVKMVSTADGAIVAGPGAVTVKYTAIDADEKLRAAVDKLARELEAKLDL